MTAYLTVLATDIDQLDLKLADGFQLAVKAIVALFLFGIALDTKIGDFRDVARRPWVIVAGLVAQYAVMPGLTVLLTLALDVRGSVAIGMILVVCCPAGNLSNILTHRARGDVALSVSLPAVSRIVA
ncbi:bile acid:sodium symporter family protein [Nocardioides hankookensis]